MEDITNQLQNQQQDQTKLCPKCKEKIKKEAIICKHCNSKLDFSSKMTSFGNNLTKFGCALTLLVAFTFLLLGLL